MAFIPAPGVIRAELVFQMENSIMENVLNYMAGPSVEVVELTELAAGLKDCWNTNIKPLMTTAISLIKIKTTSLDTESSPGIEYVTGLPIAGTATGDTLPANCAVEVILYTDLRGKSYRGRIFSPGVPETAITGSLLSAAALSGWPAAFGNLIDIDGATQSYDLCVLSRYHNNVARATAVSTPVTTIGLSPRIVSQRRRLPGRGM